MNPALPSGVHQKALEVYSYIFTTFGRQFVADHLDDFFPGLSAVLSFASLSVRPALYDILEHHILPLPTAELRPLLKALISSLLPALEEETSEDFERGFRVLETLERQFVQSTETAANNEGNGFFWQCLFLAIITSPPRRQGALNFLVHKLPSFRCKADSTQMDSATNANGTTETLPPAAEAMVSPEPGLLVRAFICGLSDTQLLVQRGFLDLLVTKLPISSPLLQSRIRKDDLDRLTHAAMLVLLRREMSLNRRLWSWFLGPESKTDGSESQSPSPTAQRGATADEESTSQLRYFASYGRPPLERSVLAMFKHDYSTTAERARPFRLCLSLMDRWEIGGSVVPQIFLPAIESAYDYSLRASTTDTTELIRSASLFFDSIEPSLIWSNILHLLDSSFDGHPQGTRRLKLCKWIIQHFNIRDEEMLTSHIPRCVLFLLSQLEALPNAGEAEVALSLDISSFLLDALPDRALPLDGTTRYVNSDRHGSATDATSMQQAVKQMYRTHQPSERDNAGTEPNRITFELYRTVIALTLNALLCQTELDFGQTVSILMDLHGKAPSQEIICSEGLLPRLLALLQQEKDAISLSFPTIVSLVSLVVALKTTPATALTVSDGDLGQLNKILTPQIWQHLSPNGAKYHVEAVRTLWLLHDLSPSECLLEATLTALVMPSRRAILYGDPSFSEAVRRFGVLWTHSISSQAPAMKQGMPGSLRRASTMSAVDAQQNIARRKVLGQPLMVVLDILSEPRSPSLAAVQSWLHSLPTLDQIYKLHFELLDDLLLTYSRADNTEGQAAGREQTDTARNLQYVLDHFANILKYRNEWVSRCLSDIRMESNEQGSSVSGFVHLVERCCHLVRGGRDTSQELEQIALDILDLALSGPDSEDLKPLDLDVLLIDRLLDLLDQPWMDAQSTLLKLIADAIQLRLIPAADIVNAKQAPSRGSISSKRPSTAGLRPPSRTSTSLVTPVPPAKLVLLLKKGFTSQTARPHLDKWLHFLSHVLPVFSDAIFIGLIPLVECLCGELEKTHSELVDASRAGRAPTSLSPESATMAFLEAAEMILAHAHGCLDEEEQIEPESRSATHGRGLLGNVTSGVFKAESPPSKTTHANSRLTVILAFQDAIAVSLRLWVWASHTGAIEGFDKSSAATTSYNALRVRNRTRHLLEQIFAVEPLESLEVIISNWRSENTSSHAGASIDLLHVLQGTRPKNVIPAILDALCSRTNPSVLPTERLSTQCTDLTALDVAIFLSAYLRSTEDDAMDEVWPDCMAFLRDVLGNPLPYRQVLPALLLTVVLLAQKLDNTNFGEQRKMRKELGDSFNRLLAATFTTMPSGYTQDSHTSEEQLGRPGKVPSAQIKNSTGLVAALQEVTANIEIILDSTDRAANAMNSILVNVIGPMLKAKSFPNNITAETLVLLLQISKKAPQAKVWKKELGDAFNDPRLLSSSAGLLSEHWFPVLAQWCLHDKERIPEVLSRLAPPSSAGIMFGVGANAARLEADRKTQLNLRRISILLLASSEDTFAPHMRVFNEKLAELFDATPSSSPSSAVKAELFMLCRAIVLSTSTVQLAPMWPIINSNLHAALASLLPHTTNDAKLSNLALLQACKLLDLLITLSPDEFQLHEWLYVTDTIDAVYQPADWEPSALSDQIALTMASEGIDEGPSLVPPTPISNALSGQRRPLLDSNSLSSRDDFRAMAKDDFAHTVLQPFLSQLSMYAYEAVYGMSAPDLKACRSSLLEDLLDLQTIVE